MGFDVTFGSDLKSPIQCTYPNNFTAYVTGAHEPYEVFNMTYEAGRERLAVDLTLRNEVESM